MMCSLAPEEFHHLTVNVELGYDIYREVLVDGTLHFYRYEDDGGHWF